MERTGVIIVAGGSGSRAGGARPKQFRFLGGMPVLARTLNTFAAALPGVQKARVKSRIILTPEHAKRLLRSLQENIVRYESNVGKIEIPTPSPASETGPKMGEA